MKGRVAVFRELMSGILSGLLGISLLLSSGCTGSEQPTETTPETGTPMADPNKQLELLGDQQAKVRRMAAKNLGAMGAAAEVAVPKLEEVAGNDPDEKAREAASQALQKIRAANK